MTDSSGDRPELYSLEWYGGEELEVSVYRKGPSLQDNGRPA